MYDSLWTMLKNAVTFFFFPPLLFSKASCCVWWAGAQQLWESTLLLSNQPTHLWPHAYRGGRKTHPSATTASRTENRYACTADCESFVVTFKPMVCNVLWSWKGGGEGERRGGKTRGHFTLPPTPFEKSFILAHCNHKLCGVFTLAADVIHK